MKILLAIAEEVLADLIAFRLELLGHSVEVCGTRAAMLERLASSAASVLLLETTLPDSGLRESLTTLRQRFTKDTLRVLCISLDPSRERVEQSYRLGADEYLLAPFDLQTLQVKLDRLCREAAESASRAAAAAV